MKFSKNAIFIFICLALFAAMTIGCGDDDDDNDDSGLPPAVGGDLDDDLDDDTDDGLDDDADDDDADDDTDDDADDDIDDDLNDDVDDDTGPDPITIDLIPGCNPFATSNECILPYPSHWYQAPDDGTATGVRVDFPDDALPMNPFVYMDVTPFNAADGAPPAGPILLHFAADVHEDFLTPNAEVGDSLNPNNSIAIFNAETGERILYMSEMDMNRNESFENKYALIIRPMQRMEMGTRHIVALTNDITDAQGGFFESPAAFAALRDGVPTTNEEIEEVRERYEDMFDFLDGKGYVRDNLLLAWDFMTASEDYLLGSVLSMREKALADMQDKGVAYVLTQVEDDPNDNLARMIHGDFEVLTFLDANSRFTYDENHHPIQQPEKQSFPFTMAIPKKAYDGVPLPLVVFGHGIFGTGREYLDGWGTSILQPLAQEHGVILIATDWIGLSGGDLDLIIEELIDNPDNIGVITERLQQSLINNITLTELALGALKDDPQVRVGDHPLIDTQQVYYYGISLGGIQGSSFVSLSPRIERGVLAVPGSVWADLVSRSIVWAPMKAVVDLVYPDPLKQQIFFSVLQILFDHSDPINLTKLMFESPLPDAPPQRAVLIQEAIGDCLVPNITTEMLARTIGIKQASPFIEPIFGLESVDVPVFDSVLSQYHMVDSTDAYTPPEDNSIPTQDNGVHANAPLMRHAMDQVINFLKTGEAEQYCDGPCDPN
jgi:hypothetical protein